MWIVTSWRCNTKKRWHWIILTVLVFTISVDKSAQGNMPTIFHQLPRMEFLANNSRPSLEARKTVLVHVTSSHHTLILPHSKARNRYCAAYEAACLRIINILHALQVAQPVSQGSLIWYAQAWTSCSNFCYSEGKTIRAFHPIQTCHKNAAVHEYCLVMCCWAWVLLHLTRLLYLEYTRNSRARL